jgi:hypothetical protein
MSGLIISSKLFTINSVTTIDVYIKTDKTAYA